MGHPGVITLRAPGATATVVPAAGGRIGSITAGATELLVTGRPGDHPMLWGAFPMAPWVGRIRDAAFTFEGTDVQLPASLAPHAGHGLVYDRPWRRVDGGTDPARCRLRIELPAAWPFGGHVEHHVALTADRLTATLAVVAGARAMPVEVGWHPWFRSRGPADVPATAMYERDDELPTGQLTAPAPPPWDDCFIVDGPVRVPVDDLTVLVGADTDHVVVFDGLDQGLAVEPQSGPPDAVHLRPRRLGPRQRFGSTMTIAWQPHTPTGR